MMSIREFVTKFWDTTKIKVSPIVLQAVEAKLVEMLKESEKKVKRFSKAVKKSTKSDKPVDFQKFLKTLFKGKK